MGRVLTNKTTLQYAIEASLGTLPGSPNWFTLEPNTIGRYGADITNTERNPISKQRARRKGTTTDLDSGVEFDADLTFSHLIDFIEGFMFASATVVGDEAKSVYTERDDTLVVVDATPDYYTVADNGDLAQGTLVYARGFTNAANNGLKTVAAASTATNLKVDETLAAEASPPTNAELEVCGFQGASGDLTIDANGDLTSTVLDFTTLGLTVGQVIGIGGDAAATKFATAADRGFARIASIAANLIELEKRGATFVADTGVGKTIHIYFGRFIRDVDVTDSDFLERSFQFEMKYNNLQVPGPGDEYEYAKGNYCNEVTFQLPLADKAGVSFNFVGTDTDKPTTSRATNAATPYDPNRTAAINTSADIARIRIQQTDETGITTDFKSLNLTLANGVTPEKALGTLGGKFMNYGNFLVNFDAQLIFTDARVADAVRDNDTLGLDFSLRNGDGAVVVDIPSLTLGGGAKEFPVNESVTANLEGMAFLDATLNFSVGFSLFPFAPSDY